MRTTKTRTASCTLHTVERIRLAVAPTVQSAAAGAAPAVAPPAAAAAHSRLCPCQKLPCCRRRCHVLRHAKLSTAVCSECSTRPFAHRCCRLCVPNVPPPFAALLQLLAHAPYGPHFIMCVPCCKIIVTQSHAKQYMPAMRRAAPAEATGMQLAA